VALAFITYLATLSPMTGRKSQPLYAAYTIIAICLFGISFLLWYLFQDHENSIDAAPTIAPQVVLPTAGETAVFPTTLPLTKTPILSQIPQTHTIQSGETLFRIATNFGLTVEELATANNITDPSFIQVGQELRIPNQFIDLPTSEPAFLATSSANQPTNQPNDLLTTNKPQPTALNGILPNQIVILSPDTLAYTQAIYAKGQELGRNPHAFSKMGDSTVENDHFLSRFDTGPYDLGDYAYLQRVIDHFPGSFNRDSAAVRIGLHSWTVFDPIWADKAICQPNETVIACEIRLHNPSILLIRLGSNDTGAPSLYDESMRQIVQYAIDNGVVPIIGTKADRNEGSNQNNDIVRQISADYQIPLWDFDPVAGTLPNRGLDIDNVHMNTFYAHDYTDPTAFTRGHAMHNLTALMVLDAMINEVIEGNS
jgi:LysM repeat protein